jgi:hypothetical protein
VYYFLLIKLRNGCFSKLLACTRRESSDTQVAVVGGVGGSITLLGVSCKQPTSSSDMQAPNDPRSAYTQIIHQSLPEPMSSHAILSMMLVCAAARSRIAYFPQLHLGRGAPNPGLPS